MSFDLKNQTPKTTLPSTGVIFGADSASATSPSTYTKDSIIQIQSIDTIADLRNMPVSTGFNVDLGGYYANGDGGGGQFYGVTGAAPGTYVDNGGTIIVPTGGNGSSAWIRIYSSAINIRWFGAKGVDSIGASVTSVDDTAAIQAACDVGSNAVYIPQGWFVVKNAITLTSVGSGYVFGEGRASVVLLADPKAQFIVDGANVTIRDLTMVTRLATANTVMASTDPAKNAVIYVEEREANWEFDNIFMFNYIGLLSTGIKSFNATCGLVKNCSVNFPELYCLWFTGATGGEANAINVVGGNYRGAKVAGIFWENGIFNLITGATVQTGAYVAGQAGIYIKNSQVNVNGCYIEFGTGISSFTGSIAYNGTNSILTATAQPSYPNLLLSPGQAVQAVAGTGVLDDTYIVSQLTSTEPGGALGGRGTYLLTGPSQTISSRSLRAQSGFSYVLDNAQNCSIISQSAVNCQCGYLIKNGSYGNTINGLTSDSSIRFYQIDAGCNDNTIFTGGYVRANLVVDDGTRTTIFANGGFWGGTVANPGIKFDYQKNVDQNTGFYYSGGAVGASRVGYSLFSATAPAFNLTRPNTTLTATISDGSGGAGNKLIVTAQSGPLLAGMTISGVGVTTCQITVGRPDGGLGEYTVSGAPQSVLAPTPMNAGIGVTLALQDVNSTTRNTRISMTTVNGPWIIGPNIGNGSSYETLFNGDQFERLSAPASDETALWLRVNRAGTSTLSRVSIGAAGSAGGALLTGSKTYDPPSLDDGDGTTTTVTVTGAALGDFVTSVSFSLDIQSLIVTGWVSAADTVSVLFQNETGATVDLGSGTLRVLVQDTQTGFRQLRVAN